MTKINTAGRNVRADRSLVAPERGVSTGKFVATRTCALPGVGEMETAANCLIAPVMSRVIRMPSFNAFTAHLRQFACRRTAIDVGRSLFGDVSSLRGKGKVDGAFQLPKFLGTPETDGGPSRGLKRASVTREADRNYIHGETFLTSSARRGVLDEYGRLIATGRLPRKPY